MPATKPAALVLHRQATLPELLKLLVAHGGEALIAAEGFDAKAEAMLYGPLTIYPENRAKYGDQATWAAWDAFREDFGGRLKAMFERHSADSLADNELRCAPLMNASEPCDWQ